MWNCKKKNYFDLLIIIVAALNYIGSGNHSEKIMDVLLHARIVTTNSAMRVSPCDLIAVTLEEAVALARASAEITHNHPEGILGAEATAASIFLARVGKSKEKIGDYICDHYYNLLQTLDEIRPKYSFNETCQNTVPQAIIAFLESKNYEDAIRNAVFSRA